MPNISSKHKHVLSLAVMAMVAESGLPSSYNARHPAFVAGALDRASLCREMRGELSGGAMCSRGKGKISLRSQEEASEQVREIVRCYILRNDTAAHGIVEWAASVPPRPPSAPLPKEGRLRSFQAFGHVYGKRNMGTSGVACTIAEVPFSEAGLGSKVWESSLGLACWALMNPAAVADRRVLELGSGCGFGGVMLAAAGARSVLLTDFWGEHEQFVVQQDGTLVSKRQRDGTGRFSVDRGVYEDGGGDVSFPLLRNLQENVVRNRRRIAAGGRESACIDTACLNWASNDEGECNLGSFDLVVGSDCVYAAEAVDPLVTTALRHMGEGGRGVFVSPSARTGLTEFIQALRAHTHASGRSLQVRASTRATNSRFS